MNENLFPQTSYSGGTICTTCGQPNPIWRATCERCGTKLDHSNTAPAPTAPSITPTSRANGIYCYNCGHFNTAGHTTCEQCGTTLLQPGSVVEAPTYSSYRYQPSYGSTSYLQERPGCVTAYAIFVAIVSGLSVIGVCWLMSEPRYESSSILLLIAFGGAIYNAIEIVGIWQMKNWGRIMVIINMALSIGFTVLQFCSGTVDMQNSTALGQLIGIPIAGYVAYWFYTNRERFD